MDVFQPCRKGMTPESRIMHCPIARIWNFPLLFPQFILIMRSKCRDDDEFVYALLPFHLLSSAAQINSLAKYFHFFFRFPINLLICTVPKHEAASDRNMEVTNISRTCGDEPIRYFGHELLIQWVLKRVHMLLMCIVQTLDGCRE